jgi:hypothetical protein
VFVRLDFYDLSEGSSLEAFLEFERRIIARYTEVNEAGGSRYLGLYRAHYLKAPEDGPGYLREQLALVGVYVVEGTIEERASRPKPSGPPPEDIQAIFAESQQYDNPERTHVVDLVPLEAPIQMVWDLSGRGWVMELAVDPTVEIEGSQVFGDFQVVEDGSRCRLRMSAEPATGHRGEELAWLDPLVPARDRLQT